MATPSKIAVFLDPVHFTRQFEILTGILDYAKNKGTITLGPRPLRSLHLDYSNTDSCSGDGVIGMFYNPEDVRSLQKRGMKVVNLTEQLSPMPLPVVVSENWHIGRLAAEHLLKRGYRRFEYFGEKHAHFSNQRHEGFVEELKKSGISAASISRIVIPDRDSISPQWFAEHHCSAKGPVGIFAQDDDIGVSVIIAAQGNGLRVPQDAAVVGVNDLELICYASPVSLTSIAPAYLRIGLEAAKLLDELLQGKVPPDTVIRVAPAGLVERMSSRFLAIEDPLVEKALAYMHANVNHRYNVNHLVRHCGKSRRTLELRFQRTVGHSMLEEINRLRVERARQLLSETDWTISRIAEECGFGEAKLLIRVFTRLQGQTPKAYRQACDPVAREKL
jgi:LacI family transcriptional regulator